MATGPQLSLTGRALRLLSSREHSRAELQRKLARFEEIPGELAAVLDKLAAKDLQSEQRAVDSLVHRRSVKLGSARIRQEMQSKGMEPEAMAQALGLRDGQVVRPTVEVRDGQVMLLLQGQLLQ